MPHGGDVLHMERAEMRSPSMKYGMAANINQSEQGRGREECKSDKKRKVFRDSRGRQIRPMQCVERESVHIHV